MTRNGNEDGRRKVWELVRDVGVAMMTTSDERGAARARPMSLCRESPDGAMWFFTRDQSLKTKEIVHHARVVLAFADEKKQHYVSVSGRARIVHDREIARTLWSEPARAWFPQGPDDPELALVAVDMEEAEYWDAASATLVMLYGYARARLTGEPANPGGNERVRF